ncbi:hypothetical protein K2173_003962 [Erythroxylum novogranatense]|uniref:Uncharacterized protein n=1 Tax=Erythroxylum novogranatense TaxID=1862640 RepID=A0AAV8SK16_9ROSI|nr:hypothetical protein K2173_003962 [Erythroxylum novogranatense]
MEEIENQDQLTLPTKRKLDPICENKESEEEFECLHSIKAQKIQSLTTSGNSGHEHNPSEVTQNGNQSVEACTTNSGLNSSKPGVNVKNAEMEANGHEEEGEDDDDDEEEEVNGKDVTVDRKGKGIMIEELDTDDDDEEDDDEDDDSSDDGSELEDDPLAEVDLDNILPSRTRRRSVHPGVYLANDFPSNEEDDDSDE